jgi:hypothetical protein
VATSIQSKTHTANSTDRTPVLPVTKPAATQTKPAASRPGDTARRLLNSLMRSLASAHV